MTDIVDRATRSKMMAAIRGRDTLPERRLRKSLHALGFRYRTASKTLRGRPDIVLTKWNAVIFVHGCFWHRHENCRFATTPRSNARFWQEKFRANVLRDSAAIAYLRGLGWRVAIVWECSLRSSAASAETALKVARWLRSSRRSIAIGESAAA